MKSIPISLILPPIKTHQELLRLIEENKIYCETTGITQECEGQLMALHTAAQLIEDSLESLRSSTVEIRHFYPGSLE